MRCLVVADLHYALQQFDWVTEAAPRFDVVVMAGDYLDPGGFVDRRTQSVVVRKYFDRLKDLTRLIVCSGNNDLDSHDAAGEKTARWIGAIHSRHIASDGASVVIDDTLFSVCPWWDGPTQLEALAGRLADDATRRRERWIWVHHAPPNESPVSWSGRRYYGDAELLRSIARHQPDFVFSGHVHQAPFVERGSWVDRIGPTWAFNMGHQYGAPPAYIAVDTDAATATWISAAGSQQVALDKPYVAPPSKLDVWPDWLPAPA